MNTAPIVSENETPAILGGPKTKLGPWPKRRLFGEEEKAAVMDLFDRCLRNSDPIGYSGPEERAYCEEFSALLGGGFADGVNSGTNALFVALAALDLPPYSEVIVPPITDAGGAMPVAILNGIPVPADCAPGGFNAGPAEIEARITPRTRAIIVMHAAGLPVDMDGVLEVARRHNLPVVEDCAQAHGSTYKGRPVGTFGDTAAFSTMFGKTHAFGGQGGVVFTKDETRWQRIRELADRGKPCGRAPGVRNVVATLNFNTDELHCVIGRAQLKKLPAMMRRRREIGNRIATACRGLEAIRMVEGIPGSDPVYWFVVFKYPQDRFRVGKAEFVTALQAEGIPFEADYNFLPMQYEWARNRHCLGTSGHPWNSPQYTGDPATPYPTPVAEEMIRTHFRLPINEGIDDETVEQVIRALGKIERHFL